MQKIPLSKCYVTEEVKAAALRAIESGQYILSKECKAFAEELAKHTGVKHCVLGTSWTMSVYLLHLTQGLKPGDEVIVPSHTAFPTMEPLIHCGATPVFVDIDETFCLDADQLESLVTPRTVGIIPVHLYGHPAHMEKVLATAARHNLWVLEDCAQAHGARYNGKRVGAMGHFSAYSFFPSKNLTVLGDGGCVMTNDSALAAKLEMLRNHGRKDKYLHEFTGFNVRFSEIHAAIGRVMLKHLDAFNDQRRAVAARYTQRLAGIVRTPVERSWAQHVYHMYVIRCDRRDELQAYLKSAGIETGIHYPVPNHQQPAVTSKFGSPRSLPETEKAVREILSLPIHGEMTLDAADSVCDAIANFYGKG